MGDGIINNWVHAQGDTEEARKVARQIVGWLMEDEPPAYDDDFDQDALTECAGCGRIFLADVDTAHIREDDTGAYFLYCPDCAPFDPE